MSAPVMNDSTFERDRLELFRANGFPGTSRWIDDNRLGFRTYAVTHGAGSRPTVLVHGGIADVSVWYRLAAHLDLAAGPVVIVDRPGHGLTTGIDYTGVDYRAHAVAWMKGVVDALGADQVDLVGNSMGGYFSTVFAAAHPQRVRRLVLAGAPAGADRPLPLFLRLWGRPITGRIISAMIRGTKTPGQMRKNVFASMCTHPERISDEALRVAHTAGQRPDWHPMIRSMVRACSDLGGWRPALSIREDLARLATPTLFAWGDKDNFAPASSGHELATRMPAATVDVLDDAGHLPQLDQPEALAHSINQFLAETSPRVRAAAGGRS